MKKSILLGLVLIYLFLLTVGCSQISEESRGGHSYAVYNNKEYRISLKYPQYWKPNAGYTPERYEADDGFFQISALYSNEFKMDVIAESEANHKLKPYGNTPQIEQREIQGQDARLILPSEDQPDAMKGQAELILKYPENVEIGSTFYNYLVLWSDKSHIEEIARSIKFIH